MGNAGRKYLSKIIENYVEKGAVSFIVNPSVKQEIENTSDLQKKQWLLALFNQFHFTSYNKTIFPFSFPARFVTEAEKSDLEELRKKVAGFEKDEKIFLDAVSSSQVRVFLTTDREHLAQEEIRDYLKSKGLHNKVRVFTPKEFYEYLQKG